MPRPGPRTYECVRRAWHSERHLPLRGSLIQEIFRFINEVHKPATRKNKEWQEKLPVVVLRAEEIMYSKANSEAEYVDLKTLGDRVDDAIHTIIRGAESGEKEGKLLQPCIEAALHLGCTPKKSSRSQRRDTLKHYLTPGTREDHSVPPCNVDNKNRAKHTTFSSSILQQPQFLPMTNTYSFPFGLASDRSMIQHRNWIFNQFSCSHLNGNLQWLTSKPCSSSNSYSVYPLCLGDQLQSETADLNLTPIGPKSHLMEAVKLAIDSSNKAPVADPRTVIGGYTENQHQCGCDLSLRLGSLTIPFTSSESSRPRQVENKGSGCSQEGRKMSLRTERNFSFISKGVAEEQFDSSSTKRSRTSRGKREDVVRKRKAVINPSFKDEHSGWQLKVPSN